ncbi:MAG: matrixin family metalloprotease [Planctomycetia bacterium]|nr:matrixin family metalloprotease [Planctomycetia bacterium]
MFGIRTWGKWLKRASLRQQPKRALRRAITAETLESRVLLFTTSGSAWPTKDLITISFIPDGTDLGGGKTSNMVATLNTKFGSAATWQNQILKGAQFWAQQTNINFAVVSDNGTEAGSGNYQQGDPGFGDIRIGGYNFGTTVLAQAFMPPPSNNFSIAGDMQLNTATVFNIGTQYDLFTVTLHEFGHSLGLYHSTTTNATMYSTYNGIDTALNSDDISGIKSVYSAGAARTKDSYDLTNANETKSTASVITTSINTTTKTAVLNGLDLTTSTDLDFYKFVIPAGVPAGTALKAKVVATGVSLLDPKVEILNSAGTSVANAAVTNGYGGTVTATYTNAAVVAGATFYVKVSSVDAIAAFKTGRYSLVLNMGTGADPAITTTTTTLAKGTPLTCGGGYAITASGQLQANVQTLGIQQTSDRAVGTAANGDYVVTWASNASGNWDVYAQRFDKKGVAKGTEFLVNQTATGDQVDPVVSVDALGNFVIAWVEAGSDTSGSGIYARRFNADGTASMNEMLINTTTAGEQNAPALASNGIGDFVVTWTSAAQDGSGTGIYAKQFTLDGTVAGSEFRVNNTTRGDQSDSAVVMNRITGEFVVTWTSSAQDGSGLGIYAQRFSSNGTSTGGEFKVNTTTAGDQLDASIAINRITGDFIVSWTGQDGSGTGVFAQRYGLNGVAQGTEFRVNTTTTGDQNDSSVAIDGAGNYFVTWAGSTTTNGWQVYRQQLLKTGAFYESEAVVNTTAAGDQNRASVSVSFSGTVVVVWSGAGSVDTSGINSQIYTVDRENFEPNGHDHEAVADHSETPVSAPAPKTIETLRQVFQALSGHVTDAKPRWLESIHRRDAADLAANSRLSEIVTQTKPRTSDEQASSIDSLFGSEAWLTGRHYQKS